MKYLTVATIVFLLIGYLLGVKFPSIGTAALSKVGL